MKCYGCSREIKSPKNCSLCENLFCSDSCIEAHQITYHRTNKIFMNNLNYYAPSKNEAKKEISSIFITEGKLYESYHYNPKFKLENFIPVFDKNKKPCILGSGSYGKVYLSKNKNNQKYYAIKHMDIKHLNQSLKSLSGIKSEIDLQSRISHPNIAKILYSRVSEKSFDLVMEWAIYGSLFDFIRKNKSLSEETSFKYFIQVANAVYFLHKNDLIHRDIKPENILIFENDNVKLSDFGWCVELSGGPRGTFCGTTEYMSPEMVNQKEYSKEIDIWSLGVLLYEMLHGHSPFIPNKPRFNEREVMENIKIHDLKFDQKVSKECKELITHLLDENRNSRFKIEDIFNSSFVKKYENIALNKIGKNNINNKKEEKKEINNHLKCGTNINNNILNGNYDKKNEMYKVKKSGITPKNNNDMNYTGINFYPKNMVIENKITTPRKKKTDIININLPNNPEDIKFEKDKIQEKKIIYDNLYNSDKKKILIQNKINENTHKLNQIKQKIDIESPKMNSINEDDKESSIINNYTLETEKNSKKNNQNDNINFIINHPNINGNIKKEAYQKKIPFGNPVITKYQNVKNKNLLINQIKKVHYIPKNNSNVNIKKKYKEENLISNNGNNSPIKIIFNNNNIKHKFEKNPSANLLKINKIKYNNNDTINNSYINNANNKTQMYDIKNKNSIMNPIHQIYTDFNGDFKNTPDEEFYLPNDNLNNQNNINNLISYGNDKIKYYNCFIINNNNNIISPNFKEDFQKKKISKTPIKQNKINKLIKSDKETIENEDNKKENTIHKSKIKSKSLIKKIIKKDINCEPEKKNSSNNIKNISIKPKILNVELKPAEKKEKITIEPLIDETNYYSHDNNENKNGNLNIINNLEFNKTIKLKNIQNDKNEKVVNKQVNNSFTGIKIIKKIKDNENIFRMVSPVKILGYNNKKIEQKNDMNTSENSKIIDEREFEVENNDDSEDDSNKTPRKTTDRVKIMPCKLISEISKKFNS